MFLDLRVEDPDQGLNSNPLDLIRVQHTCSVTVHLFHWVQLLWHLFSPLCTMPVTWLHIFLQFLLYLLPIQPENGCLRWPAVDWIEQKLTYINMHGQSINLLAKCIDNKSKSWKQQWRFFTFRMRMMWMWIFWSHAWFRASVEWAKIFLRVARLRWKIK